MKTRYGIIQLTLMVICAVTFKSVAVSDATSPFEYRVKAAFLFNFAKFVEWPVDDAASSSAPFIIGIIGRNPFGEAIRILEGKRVGNRPVQIRYFKTVLELDGCNILFISRSEKKEIHDILKKVRSRSILTVGDTEGYMRQGVMINLVTIEDKIRFDINLHSAHISGLEISSNLLRLARAVKTGA